MDSEKYLSGRSDGFVFKGEYGIVDTYVNLHEGGYEIISFARKTAAKLGLCVTIRDRRLSYKNASVRHCLRVIIYKS